MLDKWQVWIARVHLRRAWHRPVTVCFVQVHFCCKCRWFGLKNALFAGFRFKREPQWVDTSDCCKCQLVGATYPNGQSPRSDSLISNYRRGQSGVETPPITQIRETVHHGQVAAIYLTCLIMLHLCILRTPYHFRESSLTVSRTGLDHSLQDCQRSLRQARGPKVCCDCCSNPSSLSLSIIDRSVYQIPPQFHNDFSGLNGDALSEFS
jgi:hypothetical protein